VRGLRPGTPTRLLIGAIAQLGERLLCKQEVVGSIPSGSTRTVPAAALLPCSFAKIQIRPRPGFMPCASVMSDIVKRRSIRAPHAAQVASGALSPDIQAMRVGNNTRRADVSSAKLDRNAVGSIL
jgi:hypothetical protein